MNEYRVVIMTPTGSLYYSAPTTYEYALHILYVLKDVSFTDNARNAYLTFKVEKV